MNNLINSTSKWKVSGSVAASSLGATLLGVGLAHGAVPYPSPQPSIHRAPYIIHSTASTLPREERESIGNSEAFGQLIANIADQLPEPVFDGIYHPAQASLEEIFLHFPASSRMWAVSVLRGSNTATAAELLRLLCRFRPVNENWRQSIVETALASSSVELRDAAIQAVESWKDAKLLTTLIRHREPLTWLANYANGVINDYRASG